MTTDGAYRSVRHYFKEEGCIDNCLFSLFRGTDLRACWKMNPSGTTSWFPTARRNNNVPSLSGLGTEKRRKKKKESRKLPSEGPTVNSSAAIANPTELPRSVKIKLTATLRFTLSPEAGSTFEGRLKGVRISTVEFIAINGQGKALYIDAYRLKPTLDRTRHFDDPDKVSDSWNCCWVASNHEKENNEFYISVVGKFAYQKKFERLL